METVRSLCEHVATERPEWYITKAKMDGAKDWSEYVQAANWYAHRLHDRLHAVMDRFPGMAQVNHGGGKPSWDAFDLSNADATALYEKIVKAISAAKGELNLKVGREERTDWGGRSVDFGELHGEAAIHVWLSPSDKSKGGGPNDNTASVMVDFMGPNNGYAAATCRKLGIRERPGTPAPAEFKFEGVRALLARIEEGR
jgi:hypothetical protein